MKKTTLLSIFLILAACRTQPPEIPGATGGSAPEKAPVVTPEEGETLSPDTLLSPAEKPEQAMHILIDPGHGGKDSGAVKWGIDERTLNGRIALYLGEFLQEAGCRVSYSRPPQNSTVTLPLDDRVERINQLNPDLIVSIHHNSNPSDKPRGFALFWSSYRPWMDSSDIFVQRGGYNYPWVREEIRNNVTYVYYRNGSKVEEITGDDAYKIFDSSPVAPASNSYLLAASVYREMLNLNHVKAQDFGGKPEAIVDMENRILRLNHVPAVLVECGFMSNREELNQLVMESNQRETAKAISRGILAFLERSD